MNQKQLDAIETIEKNHYEISMRSMSDAELYLVALEKRKNGNGTIKAYAAQRELERRNAPYRLRGYRNGSSKRYAYNEDYMPFESDNR